MAQSQPEIPARFDHAGAWTAETLAPGAWRFSLDADCLAEILDLARFFDQNPIAVEALLADDFELPRCRGVMADVKSAATDGPLFAVLDRLPLDEMSDAAAIRVYWVLMSLIARPVAQKQDGTLIFSVADMGVPRTPGSGVRPATTNEAQHFHNDNCFNDTPPEFVTLLCQHPSGDDGGLNRMVNFYAVHNHLAENHADVLQRLYGPFYFDRQKEFLPGDPPVLKLPVFSYDGRLRVRLSPALVRAGYELAGEPLDPEGGRALDVLVETIEDPGLWVSLMLERGQILVANNQETGHARTGFDDTKAPDKRLLQRLWLRDAGRRTYMG